jgi:competence protein ComEA
VASARNDDVDDRAERRPALASVLTNKVVTEKVLPWLRFVGPARLLGGLGVSLVLAGVAWWMLRAPAAPTESRLPLAARAAAEGVAIASPPVAPPAAPPATLAPPSTAALVIHVTGAVRAPGVHELQPGQRVADAIDAAGGALANADPNALNLAAPLVDGDRVAVPVAGETSTAAGHSHAGPPADAAATSGSVDVNTATVAELETLPAIGPALAAAIVEHRAQNGPFASVDDLDAVPGIGTAKLDAIRDLVRV